MAAPRWFIDLESGRPYRKVMIRPGFVCHRFYDVDSGERRGRSGRPVYVWVTSDCVCVWVGGGEVQVFWVRCSMCLNQPGYFPLYHAISSCPCVGGVPGAFWHETGTRLCLVCLLVVLLMLLLLRPQASCSGWRQPQGWSPRPGTSSTATWAPAAPSPYRYRYLPTPACHHHVGLPALCFS